MIRNDATGSSHSTMMVPEILACSIRFQGFLVDKLVLYVFVILIEIQPAVIMYQYFLTFSIFSFVSIYFLLWNGDVVG